MQQKTPTVISTHNLSIGYSSKQNTTSILEAITINLQQGELIGIIGRNGAGKSTLLRTLSGLQPALSGTITIQSKAINDYPPLELAKVLSVVLTDTLTTSNLSVLELIALGRQPYTNWIGQLTQQDKNHIQQAIQYTKTTQLQDKKCNTLSDGERQKVLIARAIAQDTPLIILDEPTTHLDLHHKAQVLLLLKQLTQQRQKTVCFATHDITTALQLCDKLVVIKNNTVAFNTPEQLINKGIIDRLFPTDLIQFDKNNKSLRLNINK